MMPIYYSPIFRESVLCTAKGGGNITGLKKVSSQSCMHINVTRTGLYLFFVPKRIFKIFVTIPK